MNQERVHYLSWASIVSALAVVMLHTNGCFWTFSRENYWLSANVIESVMYFAVPVFFMISGATLMDYRDRYTTKEFFIKRITKTGIPFLVWSCIGVLYLALKGAITIEPTIAFLKEIILKILNTNVISIYWFFITLFGVYLCIPLFSAVDKKLRNRVFTYLVAASLLFNYIIPFVCQVFEINYTARVSVPVAGEYLIYVLLGYLLSTNTFSKKQYVLVYALAIAGLAMHMAGTYILSMEAGWVVQVYKGYTKVPCLLYSVGIFVMLKQVGQKIKSEKIISFIEKISSYTFAVYLLHWYIMDAMVAIFKINRFSIIYRVGAPFVIFIICIGIAWCVRKIPVIRKILP